MSHDCSTPAAPNGTYVFDARGVARRFRHAAIFGALSSLHAGESMRFCNDHDPLPLLVQLGQHFGDRLGVVYHRREPGEVVVDFVIKS